MAPRAYWKGYLKLSLVSCPIALFPATSEREKISFHQLNKKTGHRVKYRKVDAESGDEVDSADIIKGYEVGKGDYIELDPEELEAVAIESKRTIDIDEFVPKDEIDELYLNNPYYIAPDGEVGQQAFAVIREAIRKEGMVAIGKVVFTSREHIKLSNAASKGSRLKLTVVRRIWAGHSPIPQKPTLTMSKLGCHGVNGTFKAVKGHRLAPLA
jgi:DNA end-binding protein Ku